MITAVYIPYIRNFLHIYNFHISTSNQPPKAASFYHLTYLRQLKKLPITKPLKSWT